MLNPSRAAPCEILEGGRSAFPMTWSKTIGSAPYEQLSTPTIWLRREPIGTWAHIQGHRLSTYHAIGAKDIAEIQSDLSDLNMATREQLLARLDALTTRSPKFSAEEVDRCSARGFIAPTRLCVDPFNVALVQQLLSLRLKNSDDPLSALPLKARVAGSTRVHAGLSVDV